MTRVCFPAIPGSGRGQKGDSAEAIWACRALFAGLWDKISRTVALSGGALL